MADTSNPDLGKPFPWDELAAVCFSVLGFSPQDFWSATPREIAMALRALAGVGDAPDRSALDAMMARFPDRLTKDKQ